MGVNDAVTEKFFLAYFFLAMETENDYEMMFFLIILFRRQLTLSHLLCGDKKTSMPIVVFYTVNKSSHLFSVLLVDFFCLPMLFISGFGYVLNPLITGG